MLIYRERDIQIDKEMYIGTKHTDRRGVIQTDKKTCIETVRHTEMHTE